MKETWLTEKRRSTTIAATPDDGKTRGKERKKKPIMQHLSLQRRSKSLAFQESTYTFIIADRS